MTVFFNQFNNLKQVAGIFRDDHLVCFLSFCVKFLFFSVSPLTHFSFEFVFSTVDPISNVRSLDLRGRKPDSLSLIYFLSFIRYVKNGDKLTQNIFEHTFLERVEQLDKNGIEKICCANTTPEQTFLGSAT